MTKPAAAFLLFCLFMACSKHGKKIIINDKSEVYIKNDATEQDAKRLGGFLLSYHYFDNRTPRSVQLLKYADTFVVTFAVDEKKLHSEPAIEYGFRYMQQLLKDSLFNGGPTKVVLANEKFITIRTVDPLPPDSILTGEVKE